MSGRRPRPPAIKVCDDGAIVLRAGPSYLVLDRNEYANLLRIIIDFEEARASAHTSGDGTDWMP